MEKKLKYSRPTLEKVDKMQFPISIINSSGKRLVCKQCSSCHSCR